MFRQTPPNAPMEMIICMYITLDHEGLAASTLFLCCTVSKDFRVIHKRAGLLTYIRVSEDESPTQLVLLPVHFTADDAKQRFAVDQDLHAVLFHDFIERSRFLHKFEVVGQARTTPVLDTHPNELGLWLVEELLELGDGRWRQFHRRLPRAQF